MVRKLVMLRNSFYLAGNVLLVFILSKVDHADLVQLHWRKATVHLCHDPYK